jgi:hypothetical protein
MQTARTARTRLQQLCWATARILFILYIVLSIISLIGGFLTAPLMSWCFFADWRFWRYLAPGLRLPVHGLRLFRAMLTIDKGFMFEVPLTAEPRCVPDPALTIRRHDWPHGRSCGDCANCCKPLGHACPLLGSDYGYCLGYGSFYWRYFNCGRFPSVPEELEFYGCRKWTIIPASQLKVTQQPQVPATHQVQPDSNRKAA